MILFLVSQWNFLRRNKPLALQPHANGVRVFAGASEQPNLSSIPVFGLQENERLQLIALCLRAGVVQVEELGKHTYATLLYVGELGGAISRGSICAAFVDVRRSRSKGAPLPWVVHEHHARRALARQRARST